MSRKKIIILIIALFCIILFAWWVKARFLTQAPPQYLTAPVTQGNIEETVLATGILKPHRLVAVGARATGRIIALHVEPGDQVKQGDLLAEIDATTQENDLKSRQAALAIAQANLAQQQAQLRLAQQNLDRQRNMITNRAISQAEFDDAEAQVAIYQAQIESTTAQIIQAEVDVETAQVNLAYTRITAPSNGTILATTVQEGQNVNAVQSAPTIVVMGDLTTMTVRAEISEADIVNVEAGQRVYFNVIGNPDRRYESTLESIEPAPESIRNDSSFSSTTSATSASSSSAIYYNGVFDIPNTDGLLRTYMTAQVNIILGEAENTLLIPSDALTAPQGQGQYTVRVLKEDGEIEARQVQIGLNDKIQAQVLSGLEQGETVILGQSVGADATNAQGRRMRMPF